MDETPRGLITSLGRATLNFVAYFGQLGTLVADALESLLRTPLRFRLMLQQIVAIGFGSQVVVIVTGAFTGAVFSAQSYFKFKDFGIESTLGGIVSVSLFRELGPVLSSLLVAGRVGAAMAAEIGTMKVSEQIDALRAMGVHPVDYLVIPRFVAMTLSMPLLIAEAIVFGLGASWAVAVLGFGIPDSWFWEHTVEHTNLQDFSFAMIKGIVFGILIVVISCHQGMIASNGAVGVGRSTTRAVVFLPSPFSSSTSFSPCCSITSSPWVPSPDLPA
jgi:phospholipid/cholesterol/gamma-HCH transport system permease protein